MWKIIGCNINFCFDENQMICNNAVDIMTGKREYLIQYVGIMNRHNASTLIFPNIFSPPAPLFRFRRHHPNCGKGRDG